MRPALIALALLASPAAARELESPCLLREPPADEGVLLAEFTTRFKARAVRRAANVRLAGMRLDGVVIPARGRLSYNATVGPREAATGFGLAPVIDRGEYKERTGGGVCQPSSTLHAAALLAGLSIEKRREHTWVSPYIAPGFDATVVWRLKDLVIENPFPFAVRIAAVAEEDELTVRLLADGVRRGWVEMVTKVTRRVPFQVETRVDPDLAEGQRVMMTQGSDGLHVARARVWHSPGKKPRTETLSTDVYLPHHTLVKIGAPTAASIAREPYLD